MQYKFTGPGKYIVGQYSKESGGGKVHRAVVGELVELTDREFARFNDRFVSLVEAPAPTAEEIAETERIAEEARINAELEAEQARVVAEQAEKDRIATEAALIEASVADQALIEKIEDIGFSL